MMKFPRKKYTPKVIDHAFKFAIRMKLQHYYVSDYNDIFELIDLHNRIFYTMNSYSGSDGETQMIKMFEDIIRFIKTYKTNYHSIKNRMDSLNRYDKVIELKKLLGAE